MRLQQLRSLAVQAKDVTLQLTQTAQGKARGTLRLRDDSTQTSYTLSEAGVLQATPKWASFTARVRVGKEERAALVVLDGGNPMQPKATLRVDIEGGKHWETQLNPNEYKIGLR